MVHRLLIVVASPLASAQALERTGFSIVVRGLINCSSQALEHKLSAWGPPALLPRGLWDLPGPGIEPMSPALAGG